jgi:hypothetical protein
MMHLMYYILIGIIAWKGFSIDHVILQIKGPTAKATSVRSENAKDLCRDIFHDHKTWFLISIFIFITITFIHIH